MKTSVTVWNLQEAVSETEFNVQGVPSRSHWWEGGEKVGSGGGRSLSCDTSLIAAATRSSGAEMTQQNCSTLPLLEHLTGFAIVKMVLLQPKGSLSKTGSHSFEM